MHNGLQKEAKMSPCLPCRSRIKRAYRIMFIYRLVSIRIDLSDQRIPIAVYPSTFNTNNRGHDTFKPLYSP